MGKYFEKKKNDTCKHVTESLCCIPETDTTMLINCIKKKKKQKKKCGKEIQLSGIMFSNLCVKIVSCFDFAGFLL